MREMKSSRLNISGIKERQARNERLIKRLVLIGWPAGYVIGLLIGYLLFKR